MRTEPDLRGPRYSCADCRDTGVIECWSVEAMATALVQRGFVLAREEVDTTKIPLHSVGTLCPCGLKAKSLGEKVVEYDAAKWIRLTHDDAEDMANLVLWAENYTPTPKYDFGEYTRALIFLVCALDVILTTG